MMVIGFMHYRKKPDGLNKAYAFATVAKAEGAKLLYFSPGAVDFQKRKINGYIYENGEWINTISEFPDVICNLVGFSSDKQDDIIEKLRKEIPFTSNSIGSKMTVFKNLVKYKKFSNYLIPSEKVLSVEHFYKLLDKYRKIVFKPSSGCQGIDVYYIEKVNNGYEILLGSEKINYNFNQMSDFISKYISHDDYLVQPYINCRTKSGNSYDFRLHVQKNGNGQWVITRIYPRIAVSGGIVCNICSGGYISEITAFLKKEFEQDHYDIKKYIEEFALQIAEHMDEIQKDLYQEDLDELGIDIGLDENQKICLYEINWRPGYPPSMNMNLNVVKNAIHYAMFLVNKNNNKL